MAKPLEAKRKAAYKAVRKGKRQVNTAAWIGGVSLVVGSFLTGSFGIAIAEVNTNKAETIICSESYQRVEQLHEKGAVPLFPADSPEQQQCNINSYVKSLGQ